MMEIDAFREQSIREIVKVAHSMIQGSLDLVSGARRIRTLIGRIGEIDNPVFLPIIGFESETDTSLLGPSRENWAPEYLEKVDRETELYVERERDGVVRSCEAIIRAFSN